MECVSSAFDTSNHPAIIISCERSQDFAKFVAFFLLWLQGDLYLHRCPPEFLLLKNSFNFNNDSRCSRFLTNKVLNVRCTPHDCAESRGKPIAASWKAGLKPRPAPAANWF